MFAPVSIALFWIAERLKPNGRPKASVGSVVVVPAIFKALLLSVGIVISAGASGQVVSRSIAPDVGTVVTVTPGQVFYSDTYVRPVAAYQIDRTFKASMPGAMGLPFSFSIDSNLLFKKGVSRDGNWTVYVPEKFTASHGLLGNVLSPGDTVGLLVSPAGDMKWFVDNSNHNGMSTIWSRKLKPSDPQPKLIETPVAETVGLPLFRLVFLGVQSGSVRIRFEQRDESGSFVRDEFTFPIKPNGTAVGAVRGAEFVIRTGELQSHVVVLKPMNGEFGLPAPKSNAPPPPEDFKI